MTDEERAPILLELDQLQQRQLDDDRKAYFSQFSSGNRFHSLHGQSYQARSARRQERQLELKALLKADGYPYKPLSFNLEFYITPKLSAEQLRQWGAPKQSYSVEPSLRPVLRDQALKQSGCLHKVSAPTLEDGSRLALEEHMNSCLSAEVKPKRREK